MPRFRRSRCGGFGDHDAANCALGGQETQNKYPIPQPSPASSTIILLSLEDDYTYEVALSFAGDGKRETVREVAMRLRDVLGGTKVFFDEWYEDLLAGPDASVVLQRIYTTQARLVVVAICERYSEKPWTQDEWRSIQALERQLRDADDGNIKRMRFLPLRFGPGSLPGIPLETAIVPDVSERSVDDIADLILKRLARARGLPVNTGAVPPGQPQSSARPRVLRRRRIVALGLVTALGFAVLVALRLSGRRERLPSPGTYRCTIDDRALTKCRVDGDEPRTLSFASSEDDGQFVDRFEGMLEARDGCATVELTSTFSDGSTETPRVVAAGQLVLCQREGVWSGSWKDKGRGEFVMRSQ